MQRLSKNYQDFIYLLVCGLNSRNANASRISQMDLKALFKIAKHQNLVNVAFEPIKEICEDPEWIQAYEQGIRRSMLFDEERKHIYEFLEAQKIWYAPLKGVVLQDIYPVYGMRQMSDSDILFDANFEQPVQDFMKARGYTIEPGVKHDAYKKPPIYFFEMHKKINMGKMPDKVNEHFEDIQNRLKPSKNGYERNLDLPDFYLHAICHFMTHLKCNYGGMKYLCDIYVLLKYVFDQQKFEEFSKTAKALNVFEAQETFRNLTLKLFSSENTTSLKDGEFQILNACIKNGEHGNFEVYLKDKLKKEAKNPKELIRLAYLGIKKWGLKSIVKVIKKK